jgi:hypothetical protein
LLTCETTIERTGAVPAMYGASATSSRISTSSTRITRSHQRFFFFFFAGAGGECCPGTSPGDGGGCPIESNGVFSADGVGSCSDMMAVLVGWP